MSDLAALMQYAPTTAAGFIGQSHAQERQTNALRQQELAQLMQQRAAQEARASALHPYDLERMSLANQTSQADLPRHQAEAILKQRDAQMGEATYASDLETALAKNKDEQGKLQMVQGDRITEFFGRASDVLSQTPTPYRTAVLRDMMSEYNLEDSPRTQRLFLMAQQNPEKFPDVMRQIAKARGQRAAEASAAYQQQMETNAAQERWHRGNNETSIEVARINAEARKAAGGRGKSVEQKLEEALVSSRWDIVSSAYDAKAQLAAQAGDPDMAVYYQQKSKEYADKYLKSRPGGSAPAGKLSMGEVSNMPTNPTPTTQAPALPPQKGQQAAPQEKKPPSLADVQKMYPGVPPEKLKEAFKKKFGVDIK